MDQPVVSMSNITRSPVTTAGAALLGAGQYLSVQGVAFPHDAQGWFQFALGLLIAIAGALLRGPGSSPATPMRLILLGFLCAGMSACSGSTAIKALYMNNVQLVAAIAASLSTDACAQIGATMQPGEAQPICAALTNCGGAMCMSIKPGPLPTPPILAQ